MISVELFALLGQIELARKSPDREFSMAAELFGLHSILAEVPMEPLFGAISGDWAAARVKALRALEPDSKALADIDAEAERMLDRAKVAAETIGSTALLEKLPALYPGSGAAQSAAEERIEYALRNGSPREVAEIVGEALSPDWRPDLSTSRETVLLLRLAETLGEAGNVELMHGVIKNLARYQPDTVVALPGSGDVRLGDLRERWAAAPAPTARATFEFDTDAAVRDSIAGNFMPVERGAVPVDGGGTLELFFAASSNMLCALASGRGGEPIWTRPVSLSGVPGERPRRIVLRRDRLIVAENSRVVCLAATTGDELWSFTRKGRKIRRIAVDDGVLVVVTAYADSSEVGEVHGLDEVLGAPLWKLGSIEKMYHSAVKIGDGRLVLLPRGNGRAAVHDLYTGYPVVTIETDPIDRRLADASWIDRGRLVVPFIEGGHSPQRTNAIVASSLDDGRESWRVDLDDHAGEKHNLVGIIEMPSSDPGGDVVRLAMLELVDDERGRGSLGRPDSTLHVLDERLGALNRRPLVRLDGATHLVGVDVRQRVVIDTPLLVAIQQGRDEGMPVIQAIDPRRGVLWKQVATRRIHAVGAQRLAAPVVGDGVVAILAAETFGGRSSRSAETKLMFLDSATGRQVETRLLESGTTSGRWRDLAGIGGTLIVMGANQMDVLE